MRLAPLALALSLAFIPVLTHAAATTACAAPGLRLNEILAGPASDWDGNGTFSSRDDEWVEVVNAGPAALDLASFFLTDGDSIPRYAFSGPLPPGARAYVTGRMSYDWERANGKPAFGLSLGNSGDSVLLWQVAAGETLLVDAYTYKSHEAAADRAVGRVPDGTGDWALFDGLSPYTGTLEPRGTGCPPSPLQENLCLVTPVRATTWGGIKALWH